MIENRELWRFSVRNCRLEPTLKRSAPLSTAKPLAQPALRMRTRSSINKKRGLIDWLLQLNFFFQIVSISCIGIGYDLKCWIRSKIMFMQFKIAAWRPICFYRLIRSQSHNFQWINFILSLQVYEYQTLNKFENRHDQIQNGRPAAILVISAMTFRLKNFFFFQIVSISCIEVVYDFKCWISSKIMFMQFKVAARRPFCFYRLIRSQSHNFHWINFILSLQVYQYQSLNEFENRHDQIQYGRPAAILVTSVMTLRLNFFFFKLFQYWAQTLSMT